MKVAIEILDDLKGTLEYNRSELKDKLIADAHIIIKRSEGEEDYNWFRDKWFQDHGKLESYDFTLNLIEDALEAVVHVPD